MKKISDLRLKNQIVGPLLVASHAEWYLVCNIPFTNSTVYFIIKKNLFSLILHSNFRLFITQAFITYTVMECVLYFPGPS